MMSYGRPLIVAIDGPSGAGKGTVARTVAARLSYRHVDTGAMYRAVAWRALASEVDLGDEAAVAALAERASIDVNARVVIDGHDVTHAIRTPAIDRAAAIVAQHAGVRAVLVERQRQYGEGGGVIVEGRDIGSVVFPGADVKLYLDADPEERARRRAEDHLHTSIRESSRSGVARALAERDQADRMRRASPLTIPPDAVYIDTTALAIHEVVELVLRLVESRSGAAGPGPD
jgi:cytidylate kinase